MAQTIWIMAGEASGDLYGGRLAEELRMRQPGVTLKGMGASHMHEAGVDCLVDSTELGVVGVIEVLKHYPMFRRVFRQLVTKAEQERPDAVVLIDYPGFNVRFAKQLHARGIPVIYYISPQVWAWGKRRIPLLARIVQRMLVIFPFEVDVYKDTGLDTRFVGHPLVNIMEEQREWGLEREADLVLLLPGSRRSEIERLLEPILESAAHAKAMNPALRFVICCPREHIAALIKDRVRAHPRVRAEVVVGETVHWMQRASAGIAASGTVTVQAAILGLPLVVVYRVNAITYLIARALVKIEYITMVNLIAEQEVFEEYIQGDVCPRDIANSLCTILPGGTRRAAALDGIATAVGRLRSSEDASAAAARSILNAIPCLDRG